MMRLVGRVLGLVVYVCVWVVPSWTATATAGSPPTDTQPSAGALDYARVVRVSFASLPESEKVRYYDRVTGRRLENLPVVPCWTGPLGGSWYRPARMNKASAAKVGFIDRRGKWLIAPRFTWADPFRDGRAIVGVGKRVGVIDDLGCWIVKPGTYDMIYPYIEARALFRLRDKWGFLGLDGNVAIPARYMEAHRFSHGVALVQDDKGWQVIDRLGKTRSCLAGDPYCSGWSFVFVHGRLRVNTETVTRSEKPLWGDTPIKFGYLGTDGRIAIPLRFDEAGEFSEGLAVVAMQRSARPDDDGELSDYVYGAIDVKGRVVVPLVYAGLSTFRDGLAAFRRDGGKWGYLDRHGREVIPARFDRARPFFDGLGKVMVDGRIAFVDMTGRVVIRTGVKWLEF